MLNSCLSTHIPSLSAFSTCGSRGYWKMKTWLRITDCLVPSRQLVPKRSKQIMGMLYYRQLSWDLPICTFPWIITWECLFFVDLLWFTTVHVADIPPWTYDCAIVRAGSTGHCWSDSPEHLVVLSLMGHHNSWWVTTVIIPFWWSSLAISMALNRETWQSHVWTFPIILRHYQTCKPSSNRDRWCKLFSISNISWTYLPAG